LKKCDLLTSNNLLTEKYSPVVVSRMQNKNFKNERAVETNRKLTRFSLYR